VDQAPNRSPTLIRRLQRQQTLNFWLTNRIPRRWLTRLMGRFSAIESPRLARWSIRLWQLFADDLRLDEAESSDFSSLQACFTRRLKPGARPVCREPGRLTSPCDAVVGAHGRVRDGELLQAKGMVYRLDELVADAALAAAHRDGGFVTLRLKSSMYHRFHAPCAGRIEQLTYVSGEVFNVNPPTLARLQRLFCRNERAVVPIQPDPADYPGPVTLVPIAAVLVSSMRFTFVAEPLRLACRGANPIACNARFERGDELGWFEHGSTIVMLAGTGLRLADGLAEGRIVRVGQPLLVPDGGSRTDRQSAAS
jgi:phosphatidylserine decarboxylase